ncbi:CocE/NonD family hydrolase [uncultured Tateyamaria sp.]|uniref:CocE/NonD family hydrolase n=1 Tax=uncultured Tateyamaria sp. TaxID=455651 RepID=UPI002604C4BE|nr:CocE/NonD family hydrolase [uncultured Tateyamaria sp.]
MTAPPFSVDETDHLWIGMADGTRLAARLWRPRTDGPVPAILEYIPYRKSDMVRARDERNHPYFAAHGYACIRVDMRGSGDSEGDMPDMYALAELDDARQVINWLAAQPWCNGRVGMFGTSWGGTASLQASVDAPEALKAVIGVCATHDRFEDDIHYMGGCVLSDTFEWGATLPSILASPPTPHAGSDWKDRWRRRIENLSCPLENWLREKGRGTYWRHGSVIHEPDRLSVPILVVGGWSDRYSNSVMSLVDARPDLVWGVVGPWGHQYPDHGAPGPAMGFQHLALEWWDQWLKPDHPAPPDWPRLRAWLREFDPPHDTLDQRAGTWIESDPPILATTVIEHPLLDLASTPAPWAVPNDPQIGLTSGDTGYFGRAGGLPTDQTRDDARSLVFETAPLDQDLVIFGAPSLSLVAKVNGGPATLVARMSDVDPQGGACRISYGVRNLALDDALDQPDPPLMDGVSQVMMTLHSTAYRVRKGHKLRVAVSDSLWPLIWSSGSAGHIAIETGTLSLPVLRDGVRNLQVPLPEPEDLPAQKSHTIVAAPQLERWSKTSDTHSEVGWHQPETRIAYHQIDSVFGYTTRMVHQQDISDRVTERVTVDHSMTFVRPDGTASVVVDLQAQSAEGGPQVHITLHAKWDDEVIGQRTWVIPSAAGS